MQLMGQNYLHPRPLEEAETPMRLVNLQHEQQIWATLWHAPAGDGHPLFQHHTITLETTLADANLDARSKCWLLRIPEGLRGIFGDTCTSAILFREDYLEALRAAFRAVSWDDAYVGVEHVDSDLSNSKFNNPFLRRQQVSRDWKSSCLVLTGGPGIGKSLWLVTVLILRLHARLPTIYQRQNDRILFFDQDGPVEFRTVVDLFRSAAVRRHQRGELWVLVDTNDELQTVDRCYRFQHAFIIQATATVKHTRWMRKLSFLATHFVLQPWSLAELIVGRILHENAPSGGSILEFTQKFGNMPENVYKYADAQAEYEAQVLARVSFPPSYPASTSFDKIAFDYPEFIALRPTSSQPWYYAPHFVSKHVVHFLFLSSDTAPRAVREAKHWLARVFYREFLRTLPWSRLSALWIREASARRSFQEGRVWALYPPAGCSLADRHNRRDAPPPKRLVVEPGGVRVFVVEGSSSLAYPCSTSLPAESHPDGNTSPMETSDLSSGADDILLEVDIDYVALYDRPTHTVVVLQPLRPVTPMPAFEQETRDRLRELRRRLEQESPALVKSRKEIDVQPKIVYVLVPTGGIVGDNSAVWLDVADLVDEVYDMEPEWEDVILSYGMFI